MVQGVGVTILSHESSGICTLNLAAIYIGINTLIYKITEQAVSISGQRKTAVILMSTFRPYN